MEKQSDTPKLHDTLTESSHGLGIKWENNQIHLSCMIHLLSAVMVLVSSGKQSDTPKLHDTLTEGSHGLGINWKNNQIHLSCMIHLLSAAMVLVSSGKTIRYT